MLNCFSLKISFMLVAQPIYQKAVTYNLFLVYRFEGLI